MDDLCMLWYCSGRQGVLSAVGQPAGDGTASPPPKSMARRMLRSVLRPFLIVPLALATQFRCVCPEYSGDLSGKQAIAPRPAGSCGLHSRHPRPRSVCKPEMAATTPQACCCSSQRAPRPAFNTRASLPCCLLARREGGKSGAVRARWRPNRAHRRIIHTTLDVSSSVWLHELAASRLTALRERPAVVRWRCWPACVHRKKAKVYRLLPSSLFPSIFPSTSTPSINNSLPP